MSGATADGLVLELELSLPDVVYVGAGNTLFLRGRCYHRDAHVKRLEIAIDGRASRVVTHSRAVPEVLDGTIPVDPKAHVLTSRFWAHVALPRITADREVVVDVIATLDDGRTIRRSVGRTTLRATIPVARGAPTARVAVCGFTSDPSIAALRSWAARLADGIDDWALIVVDDRSPTSKARELDAFAAEQPRVFIVRNETRLGPLRSLERGLACVAQETSLLAIGDFASPASADAVTSSVRQLDAAPSLDAVVGTAPADLASALVMSDSRGGAVVFRSSIADVVLPFPADAGVFEPGAWIAAVATQRGGVRSISGALHARRTNLGSRSVRRALAAAARSSAAFTSITLAQAALLAHTLHARSAGDARVLRRMERADRSVAAALGLRAVAARAVSSLVLLRSLTFFFKLRGTQLLEGRAVATAAATSIDARIAKIEHDIAPLSLSVSSGVRKRINVVVPTIDFRYVFGAYLTIFHLVEALHARGSDVRIVMVQERPQDATRWKSEIRQYPGLESLLDHVEIVDVVDRSIALEVNPADAFIATTSWTAHVASSAAQALGRERFTFLVLEYDPLVHPTGSIHELSASAYDLPHDAIFSTELLERYFRTNGLGVFKTGGAAVAIDNPIDVHEQNIVRRTDPGILFYARPEEHAARNLFEIGVLALRRVAARRGNELRSWRIHGIGALQPATVELGDGLVLDVLQRVPLDRYLQTLESYDVGIALQATPHPGLVALDMAAAGVVAVTSSYATKTAADLTQISSNIEPCGSTIDDVARAIEAAIDRAADVEARSRGRELAWPRTWDDALGARLDEICAFGSLQSR